MEKTNKDVSHDGIELRSARVRKILEERPSFILRWGIPIIALIILGALMSTIFLPFPMGRGESIFDHIIGHIF